MEEKCRFAAGACGKASIFLAKALKSRHVFAATFLLAAGAAMHFAGAELFQPAFAEQSPTAALSDVSSLQQPPGISYHRTMSELLSVVTSHGGFGASAPTSHYRSISESMSVTTVQGKAPNSYSRSMSEQAALMSGMPSSPPPAIQPARAAPAPYSASSNQRIDERLSPTLKILGKRADMAKSTGGTPHLETESFIPVSTGSPDHYSEIEEMLGQEADPDGNSALLRQIAVFEDYSLMQQSVQNAAALNASVSLLLLSGSAAVLVAKQPLLSGGRLQRRMRRFFLLKCAVIEDAPPQMGRNSSGTYVFLLVLVVIAVSSMAVAATPSLAQDYSGISRSTINISAAYHLDSDRRFLSNVTAESRFLDDIWSEEISDGNYIRATFEQNLTSARDITIYPRVVSGEPRIEIYEGDGNYLVTEFPSLNSNQYNKVFLTNLQGIQDTFDLMVVNGSVEFDYIVDPTGQMNFTSSGTFTVPADVIQITVEAWGGGGGGHGAASDSGGGGGGAYSRSNLTVVSGQQYTVTIGAGGGLGIAGGDTSFSGAAGTVMAKGGNPGSGTNAGTGGQAGTSIGEIKFSGGSGGGGGGFLGKAGGGGAAAGNSNSGANGQAGGGAFGQNGVGGQGQNGGGSGGTGNTSPGSVPGGGGGGNRVGAGGKVIVSWFINATRPVSEVMTVTDSIKRDLNGYSAGTVYRSNTGDFGLNSVKYRQWDPSANIWSPEVELPFNTGSPIRDARILFSPISEMRVVVSISQDGTLNLFRCDASCIEASSWTLVSADFAVTETTLPTNRAYRPFDIEFEQQSGMLLIVYDKDDTEANDFYYRTYDGSALSGESGFSYTGGLGSDTENIYFIRLASKPVSDEIAMVLQDNIAFDAYAFIFDATTGAPSLATQVTLTTSMSGSNAAGEAIGIAYDPASKRAAAFAGNGADSMAYAIWSGSSWSPVSTVDPNPAVSNDIRFLSVKPSPSPTFDSIMVCQVDDLNDLSCAEMDNGSLGAFSIRDTSVDSSITRPFDFIWGPGGSGGMLAWGTDPGVINTEIWVGSSWLSPATVAIAGSHAWIVGHEAPTSETVLALFLTMNSGLDIGSLGLVGTTLLPIGAATHTSDTITFAMEGMGIDWQTAGNRQSFRLPSETMTITDIVRISVSKPISEQIGLNESISISISKPLSEQMAMADTRLNRSFVGTRSPSEQLAMADATAKAVTVTIIEQMGVQDVPGRLVVLARSTSEQLGITDAITKAVSTSLADSLVITDDPQRSIITKRSMSEQIGLTETITKSASTAMSEQLAIAEVAARMVAQSRSPSEELAVADSLDVAIVKPISESLTLTDDVSRSVAQSRSMTEQLASQDSIATASARGLSEQLSVSNNITRTSTLLRAIAEQMATTDAISKSTSYALTEQLAMHDNINRSITSFRTATESMAIQDTISKDVATTLEEQLEMTEQVGRAVTQSKSASEELAVADTLDVAIVKPISESLTLTDEVARSLTQSRSMTEQMAAQETISAASGKSLSEQLGVTEAITRTSTISREITDQLTVTDKTVAASSRSLAEQLGMADTIQRSIVAIRTPSEELGVADTISKSVSMTLSEQLALAESAVRSSANSRSLSEQMILTDTTAKAVTVAISEQLGVEDDPTRSIIVAATMSEQLNLTDSAMASASKSMSEQQSVHDTIARSVAATRLPSEQLAVNEGITKAVIKSMSESLGISDSLTRSVTQSGSISEQLAIVETITTLVAKPMSEQLGVTESPARSAVLSRAVAEQMVVNDMVTAQVSKAVLEQLAIQDTIDRSTVVARSIAEQLSVTETAAKSAIQSASLTEGLVVTDSVSRSVAQSRPILEQLTVTDVVDRSILPSRSISEQLTLSDSLAGVISNDRAASEQLSVQDAIEAAPVLSRTPADILSLAESAGRSVDVTRTMSEQLSMEDSVSVVSGPARLTSDQLSLSESATPSQVLARSVTEQLGITESMSKVVSIGLSETIAMSDSAAGAGTQGRLMSEQLAVMESISIAIAKPMSEQLSLEDAITAGRSFEKTISEQLTIIESIMTTSGSLIADQLNISDAVAGTSVFARNISENLALAESAARTTAVSILESLSIKEEFANIAVDLHLTLGETLVLPDSLATNEAGDLDSFVPHTLTIGDSVLLVLSTAGGVSEQLSVQDQLSAMPAKGRATVELMQIHDSLTIMLVRPPPPAPPAITSMPSLTMTEKKDAGGMANPIQATEVSGTFAIDAFDNNSIASLLAAIGMPTYDISTEAASPDIDEMTIILQTFNAQVEVGGADPAGMTFLTPTLSDVPAGMQIMIPIDMTGAGSLTTDQAVINFTPAVDTEDFAIMITIQESNPEEAITQEQPDGSSAFYIDVSYVGIWSGGLTPNDEAFYEEPPKITFTITEDWAEENDSERNSDSVPVIILYLLDEATGEWIEISGGSIDYPTTAVGDIYTYTATLPHLSTYVVTASTEAISGGSGGGSDGGGSEGGGGSASVVYVRSLAESLFVTGITNLGGEGAVLVKDLNESLGLDATQPPPLHQHVITVHDVSVAVNVVDIGSASFGTAAAVLNLEITNKGGTAEMLVLKYWYPDPATGQRLYEAEQQIMIDPGESITEGVEVPFISAGNYDVTIEVESKDGTVSTTDISIDVPWLSVYLYMLVAMAIVIVAASIAYVIWSMRRHRSFITGGT